MAVLTTFAAVHRIPDAAPYAAAGQDSALVSDRTARAGAALTAVMNGAPAWSPPV